MVGTMRGLGINKIYNIKQYTERERERERERLRFGTSKIF